MQQKYNQSYFETKGQLVTTIIRCSVAEHIHDVNLILEDCIETENPFESLLLRTCGEHCRERTEQKEMRSKDHKKL